MATLELIVTSNASSVLPSIDRRLDSTADKAEKLKKQFSSIDFKFPTGGFTNPLPKMPDVSSFTSTLKNIASDTIKFTIAVGAYFLEVNSKFEQMEILLRMTTGSAKEGQQVFDNLINLSAKVPYSIDSLTDMFVKLTSAGIGPAYDYTVRLTDALSAFDASSDKLKLVSIAIMQMASKGTLSMEELKRQFGEQVPTALRLLQDELRKTGKLAENESLADAIGAGKIGAKTGIEALISSLERYKGVGEERMNSFKGSLVLVDNQIQLLMRDIGKSEGSFSSIGHAIQAAADMIEKFRTSAEGMEVIEKIARGVADGFNKITEHPEVIYQYFITIGELVGTATSALKFMVSALNNVLSTYDLLSGKISATAFMALPKGFDMDSYSKVRSQLIEYTDLKNKAENSSVAQSAKGFLESPAAFMGDKLRQSLTFNSKETLSFGDIDKTKEQLDKLFSVISSGGTELSNYVQVQGKSASASDDQKVAMQGVVDILGKNNAAQKEHNKTISYYQNEREKAYSDYQEALKGAEGKEEETRVLQKYHEVVKKINDEESRKGASGALKAEKANLKESIALLRNYTNELDNSIKGFDKFVDAARSANYEIESLSDIYATAGFSEFAVLNYEQAEAVSEATVAVKEYANSFDLVEEKLSGALSEQEDAISKLASAKADLNSNTVGSFAEDQNKVDGLNDKIIQLTDTIKELRTERERLYTNKAGAEKILGNVDVLFKDHKMKEVYSQIGASTSEVYDYLAQQYKNDIVEFEKAGISKLAAMEIINKKMAELNKSAATDLTNAMTDGFTEYAESSKHLNAEISSSTVSAFARMNDSLVNFVKTGKFEFGDLLDFVTTKIIELSLQASVTGPLPSLFGGLFGSSGGGSGWTNPDTGFEFGGLLDTIGGFFGGGRASGGPVTANKMYQVNENGTPELLSMGNRQFLMMGNQGGNVTPMSGASGNTSVFHINITGDVSRQTRKEIYSMIPDIASGVNAHNKEKGTK